VLVKKELTVVKVILVDHWFSTEVIAELFNGVLFLGVLDALKLTNQVFTLIPLIILDGWISTSVRLVVLLKV